MRPEELIERAKQAMKRAYVPYSKFMVGAALLCEDGSVYEGCNIENAAYSPSNCAERTAFFKAVYDGKRNFKAIAVYEGMEGRLKGICPPCGVCRQVMREFCGDDFMIYMAGEGICEARSLKEILPCSFSGLELRGEK